MNAVVFGATPSAKALYDEIKINYNIIAYCDNDRKNGEKKWIVLRLFLRLI